MNAAAAPLPRRRYGRLLPPLALVVFAVVVGAVALASGATFGYDFLAYHQAAGRVLAGEPLYDTTVEQTGGFGLFYYPPPFALLMLPLGLVDGGLAAIVWFGLSVAALLGAVALMPVPIGVRWTIVLLAGVMWPVAYTLKLGQVGALLMLAFSVGWRWLDDPVRLGASAAAGALVKLQPALLLAWAALTGRWRAVLIGIAVGTVACLLATLVVGPGAWFDYVTLLRQVSDPVTTPHNFTPGAIAYQLGASPAAGAAIQLATSVATVFGVVAAARWATPDASFLVTVVASQLLSPVLWDHYAILLLLPVAWLIARRHWWAVAIPVALSVPAIVVTPAWAYPVAFGVALIAVLAVGVRERRRSGGGRLAPIGV